MASGGFGGGVIFVVAALLWAAVLVPSWIRRREFKAAEQNALRLQRTLRVLAETAEVPTEVRVEATAREALAQERLLRTAQRRQEAERKAQLSEARAAQVRAEMRAQQMKRKQAAIVRSAKLQRSWVRRVRHTAALVFVLAALAVLVGAGLLMAGVGPGLLLGALATATATLGALVLLAPGRVKHVQIDAEQVVEKTAAPQSFETHTDVGVDPAVAAHAAAQAAAAARIERARAMARARAERPVAQARRNQPDSMLLSHEAVAEAEPAQTLEVDSHGSTADREAQAESQPSAPTSTESAAQKLERERAEAQAVADAARAKHQAMRSAAAQHRLSQMGVVGDTSDGMLDLDEALRSRRRAG